MKQSKIEMIDCEPKWLELLDVWESMNELKTSNFVRKELEKMAICCDRVRQAQKSGRKWLKL